MYIQTVFQNRMVLPSSVMAWVVLGLVAMTNLFIGPYVFRTRGDSYANKDLMDLNVLLGMLIATRLFVSEYSPQKGYWFILTSYESTRMASVLLRTATIIRSTSSLRNQSGHVYEYSTVIRRSSLGLTLMISAGNLLRFYLGLELSSLSLFLLAAMNSKSAFSTEAALKYFLVGSLASALFLRGGAFMYHELGTLSFSDGYLLWDSRTSLEGSLSLRLFVLAILMKLGAAPFHWWVPDVYEGSPMASSFFIVTIPKLALFSVLARFSVFASHNGAAERALSPRLAFVAALSIFAGMIFALSQPRRKRFRSYSGVNHMGFMLMGLVGVSVGGISSARRYLQLYILVSVLAWGLLVAISSVESKSLNFLSDFTYLGAHHPAAAARMTVAMVSMAGLPPVGGFFAKLDVLMSAIAEGYVLLAVLAVLLSVVAAFYYLRFLKMMFFEARSRSPVILNSVGSEARVLSALSLGGFRRFSHLFELSSLVLSESLVSQWKA